MILENYIKTYEFRQKSGKGFFNDILISLLVVLEIFSVEVNSMKNLSIKLSGMFAALSLIVAGYGVNSCMLIMHQPKLPKGAEKLRKY